MKNLYYSGLIFLFITVFPLANCSFGDSSNEYKGCYHVCHFNNCTSSKSLDNFEKSQSLSHKLFFWSCQDECKYQCMWHATQVFLSRDQLVPQFFGKWPFIRILGIQEPASAIFSFFNFGAHVSNIFAFRKNVPNSAPFYGFWHLYCLVCLNAWMWSFIFHARDTPFTERMDYFCAFSMVVFSLFGLLMRVSGKGRMALKSLFGSALTLFFIYHIWYLSSRRFDYGYNMKVNVATGLLNGFGWLLWSWSRVDTRQYLYWCRVTIALLGASMLLELLDFSPYFWIFDAHSLWHLSTSFLPYYWYKFLQADCLYLLAKRDKYKTNKRV